MHILCGDIGGTKTRLAIVELARQSLSSQVETSYPSAEYDSLAQVISDFTRQLPHTIRHAAFGVAGPVLNDSCSTTNLPWVIDAKELSRDLELDSTHLLNDLEATAWGIDALDTGEIHTLQPGAAHPSGNRAVIAAGTGLGEAGAYWNGTEYVPFATEGGHSDFAPGTELESRLLTWMRQDKSQVCWEDLLSGPGLCTIYRFLLQQQAQPEPGWLQQQSNGDQAARICELAETGDDRLAAQSMQLFARLYGAEAGNLGLKLMARGGVYLGGGIAPRILPWLQTPEFLQAFRNKGKMQELMESMPVRVILNDRAALYGPAIYLREKILQV
jgi:glucokinase